jgi:hypothetical protein
MKKKPRLLVLFAQEWDRLALAEPALADRYEIIHAGFDLFRFPENARLLTFDVRRFVDRLVSFARRRGVAGVLSPQEQMGVSIAAAVARRLGLPGPDPRGVLVAQHKFYAREAIGRALPAANPAYGAFRYDFDSPAEVPLPFPFFVKPVKATFSVLARRVDALSELRRHLTFHPFERHIMRRLVRPFNDLLGEYTGLPIDAHHMVAEGLVDGLQVNVDGYVHDGRVHILGVVDEIMYPGTRAFLRFEYPSALPEDVHGRLAEVATGAVRAVGLDHGLFNVELAFCPASGAIKVIEINPRIASQFITLYDWVHGIRLHEAMVDLALGAAPRVAPGPAPYGHAASFVYRTFDGSSLRSTPSGAQLRRVSERHPDARLMLYAKRGADLAREVKWLGSHRYALLNVPGRDREEVFARQRDICAILGFDCRAQVPDDPPLIPANDARADAAPRRPAARLASA